MGQIVSDLKRFERGRKKDIRQLQQEFLDKQFFTLVPAGKQSINQIRSFYILIYLL